MKQVHHRDAETRENQNPTHSRAQSGRRAQRKTVRPPRMRGFGGWTHPPKSASHKGKKELGEVIFRTVAGDALTPSPVSWKLVLWRRRSAEKTDADREPSR